MKIWVASRLQVLLGFRVLPDVFGWCTLFAYRLWWHILLLAHTKIIHQAAGRGLVVGLLTEISKTDSAVSHSPWSVGSLALVELMSLHAPTGKPVRGIDRELLCFCSAGGLSDGKTILQMPIFWGFHIQLRRCKCWWRMLGVRLTVSKCFVPFLFKYPAENGVQTTVLDSAGVLASINILILEETNCTDHGAR